MSAPLTTPHTYTHAHTRIYVNVSKDVVGFLLPRKKQQTTSIQKL